MTQSSCHDITAYGAIGDGKTLNTAAIQKSLDAVGDGGVVIVPPGTFLTGTIFLRSNTVLELLPGATLLGSPRLEDYTRLTTGIVGDRTGYHLVVADGVRNVTIRGQGPLTATARRSGSQQTATASKNIRNARLTRSRDG